jgi:inhibitor of KinA
MTPTLAAAGDQGFLVRFGDTIDPAISEQVLDAVHWLETEPPAGVLDVVPGYAAVLVVHDPGHADPAEVRSWITRRLGDGANRCAPAGRRARRVEIPVLYDGSVAPDLEPLAALKGLSVKDLVELHTAAAYRCYLLGFRPGFPFLGGLDARLHTPRLASPRAWVAAGSVGIGGQQTGIYPVSSPGGWRIIGRTPLRLFEPGRADPFLVHPGDQVAFIAVEPRQFLALGGAV